MKSKLLLLIACFSSSMLSLQAQGPNQNQLGAWYMYFFNKKFGDSQFGIQGDYQFRYWNAGSDLEQILLRTGFTYRPKSANVLFTLGYGNITSGTFGVDDKSSKNEHRIYQEALIPQKLGKRVHLTHRFRFEQRWVDIQDMRTRYRYNLFLNVTLNGEEMRKGVFYTALYNELFINGEQNTGVGTVEYFDRNRTYLGLGYGLIDNMRVQLGWMRQATNNWTKGQAQLSLHHNF